MSTISFLSNTCSRFPQEGVQEGDILRASAKDDSKRTHGREVAGVPANQPSPQPSVHAHDSFYEQLTAPQSLSQRLTTRHHHQQHHHHLLHQRRHQRGRLHGKQRAGGRVPGLQHSELWRGSYGHVMQLESGP